MKLFTHIVPTDVLIYGGIDEYTSADFINSIGIATATNADEICVRVNTPGGSPEYAWGMIAKFNEITGKKSVRNDGQAYSMGLFFNCYVDKASALDTTQFLLHRAAYPEWLESSEDFFTPAMKLNLDNINKKLRAAFEAKVDVDKFENLKSVKDKGITLDSVFSMEDRVDVFLTAQEAKKIGLISEIITITPAIKAEIDSHMVGVMAKYSGATKPTEEKQKPNKNTMTIEQLKAEHPAVYAQAVAEGVSQEKDRVEACMAFIDIDAKGVKAAIEAGKPLSQKQMADFALKAFSPAALEATKTEAAPAVTTGTASEKVETEDEKKLEAFRTDYKKLLKK